MKGLAWLNRNPTLFRSKRFHLVYFGLFSALASLVGYSLFFYYLDAKGVLAQGVTFLIGPCLVICIWCCGRIGHLIAVRQKKGWNETGFYSQAAILGSLLVIGIFSFLFHFPYLIVVDGICFALPLALAVARLGCYNYGCCYGRPTEKRWGVVYHHPDSKVLRIDPSRRGRALHPVQLYAAGANLIVFLLIVSQINRSLPDGAIVTLVQFFYACKRLILDRYRDTSYNGGAPRYLISSYTLAMLLVVCGFLLFGYGVAPTFLLRAPIAFNEPLSAGGLVRFVVHAPVWLTSVAFTSLLAFFGYGYHGKKLGTFVNV